MERGERRRARVALVFCVAGALPSLAGDLRGQLGPPRPLAPRRRGPGPRARARHLERGPGPGRRVQAAHGQRRQALRGQELCGRHRRVPGCVRGAAQRQPARQHRPLRQGDVPLPGGHRRAGHGPRPARREHGRGRPRRRRAGHQGDARAPRHRHRHRPAAGGRRPRRRRGDPDRPSHPARPRQAQDHRPRRGLCGRGADRQRHQRARRDGLAGAGRGDGAGHHRGSRCAHDHRRRRPPPGQRRVDGHARPRPARRADVRPRRPAPLRDVDPGPRGRAAPGAARRGRRAHPAAQAGGAAVPRPLRARPRLAPLRGRPPGALHRPQDRLRRRLRAARRLPGEQGGRLRPDVRAQQHLHVFRRPVQQLPHHRRPHRRRAAADSRRATRCASWATSASASWWTR